MNAALLLLSELESLDVRLSVEAGRLRYSAPKGVMTQSLLARLGEYKAALKSLLEQRALDNAWDEAPIPVQPRGNGLPLSTAQQRFWFLDRLDHGNSAAFVMPPVVLRLGGKLNVQALERSLNAVVQRHEVLRSAFRIEGDAPVQVVLPGVEFVLPLHDLSALDPAARENEVAQVIRREAVTPFDLQRGEVLMRALLLCLARGKLTGLDCFQRDAMQGANCAAWPFPRKQFATRQCARREQSNRTISPEQGINLATDEHCFILTMHHIISDGWSMGILVDELSQLYRAFVADQADPLPALPIQYADYAHWERARLSGERLARLRDYWLKQLEGAPTFLELPTHHPRPKIRGNRGQAVHFQLDADFSGRLAKLCGNTGVTPFMALLAAFGVLLCRYTDSEELVIGSPIALRPHSQTEVLIGLFLNTLAFRLDLSGNPTFIELLGRVRKTALEAFEHREMPFDQLLQALNFERNLDHTPLFQVLFAMQNAPMGGVELEGLSITPQPTETLHAPFDLVLSVEETPQGINGFFRYNCDLFEQDGINRMVTHFRNLLEGLVTTPSAAIRTLPMLDAAELRLLRDCRGGESHFPVECTLHRKFELQVPLCPDSIAVRFEDISLTYSQLDERANQVAHRLRHLGVAQGGRVGLCAERSIELVIGLVGILKAGAAYVPLDPSYPEERLRYMAQDSGLKVVLAHRAVPPVEAAVVDLCDPTLADESPASADVPGEADDVAYVIYTSGSTGRPKGVEVTHANVARLFSCCESLFGFGADDVWCLFHSYAFDLSVWELWGTLLYGGQIVVVPFAVSRSPDQFHAFLKQSGITVLTQTPSAFRQLMEADRRLSGAQSVEGDEAKLKLKWVIFAGEALDPRSLSGWVERHGLDAPQLINMYGITETTVHTTYHRVTAQEIAAGVGNIGRPLPDLSIELVDRYGQWVPLGVSGEILVGGAGVAKGYLNLPDLTAARFTVHTLPGGKEERQYHSGDLARLHPDGRLEYLGRIDHQVKVRGFRIELGEIESCLAKHAQVSDVTVEARQDTTGTRLIAFVASHDWQDVMLPSLLRAHLKALLPDYMVPAVVLVLSLLPLTVNGKLDRKTLADLLTQFNAAKPKTSPAPPRTPVELMLVELWSSVLGVADIGIDDNFFELGGDSIRGAILANKIQERIRNVVYVVALFEAPTIRRLADYLRVHYPEAMARLGEANEADVVRVIADRVDEKDVAAFRRLIPPTPPNPSVAKTSKNPRMVFVLSPPRSGSTLLRVLLGGHPRLFSPPELELLNFDTLAQRKEICSGRDAFWLEGTLRAVMEALQVDAIEAKRFMAVRENGDTTVKDFYRELQSLLPNRMLVDKSPSYALDVGFMQRAEDYFDEPLYIHLHRHPYGMINSFEEARLDQIFFRYPHNLPIRRLAELIWLHSHRNITEFLAGIPEQRQFTVSFEEISQKPQEAVKNLCAFIGIDFDPEMLGIYEGQNRQNRMTDGIYRESKMLGDTKFHTHKRIDPTVAERWREIYREDFLGEPSWAMAERLGYARLASSGTAPIKPIARGGALPLSFAQQRLWFLDQLEGAGTAYNMPVALRIKGMLNRDALATSLRAIMERHEVLRSRFETVDGVPVVRIADAASDMTVFDLSGLEAGQQEAEIMRRAKEDTEKAFDLARGPLFRSALLILGESDHVVLINMHHIVSDGWSMGVMVNEWSRLYNAAAAGKASTLPPLPIQYADYADWQRRHFAGEGLARQLGYWRTRLIGAPALLELPTDRPRPAIQRFSGDTLELTIDAALSAQLKHYADQSGVSRYMLLMAAFAVLLARYSGQRDIVLGSPTANRTRNEVEPLIGFFVNTLVMRLGLTPDQPFDDFLAHVRQICLEAYAHQDVPFEQLVEELRPQRNLSYSPLFQVMFSMQNAPLAAPVLTGLEVTEIATRQVVAKYDLTLALTEKNGALEAVFEYNSDLFERATVARFASHYVNLLKGIIATPHQSVGRLPLLSAEETSCIVGTWNETATTFTGAMTLHGLFEEQVLRTPEAIALQFCHERLSYRELNQRAEQLAQRLRAAGLVPGGMAAVAVVRSKELLISLLAILKTGCAYVPLDPDYPPERIRYVLDDAKVSLLVTQSPLLPKLPATDCRLFLLDDTDRACKRAPITAQKTADAGLAYVMYTSGSTGNPKGVMISHYAAANLIRTAQETPGIHPTGALLAVTTISFDISVMELFLPLSVGAKVIIADEATTRDAHMLMQTIATEHITFMQATPATWRMLLAAGWPGNPELDILCGGEAMSLSLARQLLACCGNLWNGYGPTETTIWSTIYQVTEADLVHATIPIGKPIANTRLYILDAGLGVQPVGVTGELFIGGVGLAAGYLHRPDLTAERFIPDPFLPGKHIPCAVEIDRIGLVPAGCNAAVRPPGTIKPDNFHRARYIYRTGDLARYLADGRIEYMGRIDWQVKVRGFRVELGEVEHVLARQPGVTLCAVGLERNTESDARLIAYYVGETTDGGALKRALNAVLPDYMVPSLIVRLPSMPLTPNGKIDRLALKPPEGLNTARSGEHAGFRDSVELDLVHIWEEVLNLRPIGIRDNFFELGGHSLIAVRLMAKVAQRFNRQLPLSSLFQGATVEAMARLLRNDALGGAWSSVVPIQTLGRKTPFYCVAGAGGNVVYFHALAQAMGIERPFYGLQPPGLDGITPPHSSIENLAAHYLAAIEHEQQQTPQILAGHSFGGLVAYEMARQLSAAGKPPDALVLIDTSAPHFLQPTGADWSEAKWLAQVSNIAGHLYGVEIAITPEQLEAHDNDTQLALVHDRLTAAGVLPEGSDIRYFRGFIEVYKANLRAVYTPPQATGNTRALLLRSQQEQPEHLISQQVATVRAAHDLGWQPYFSWPVTVREVPGDHLTMMHSSNAKSLAASLAEFLS